MSADRPLNAKWDDHPEEYDRVRDGHLNRRRTAFLLERIAAEAQVVEVGSGTGWLGLQLARARPEVHYTGVDPLPGYVAYASAQATAAGLDGRVGYRTGTGEGLAPLLADLPPASHLLANDVLHHVHDLDLTARAAAAVARPGARWIVIEPNAVNPYVWLGHTLKDGEAIFRWRRFLRAARRAGWTLERRTSLFAIPPQLHDPPAWAVRVERHVERVRPLAGGIALELRLR